MNHIAFIAKKVIHPTKMRRIFILQAY